MVVCIMIYGAFCDERGNDQRWDPDTKLLKVKVVVVVPGAGDRVAWVNSGWRHHMIVKSPVLVIRYDEQAFFPVWRTTYRLVNIFEESLAACYVVIRMLGGAASEFPREGMVVRFQEHVGFRELRIAHILFELAERPKMIAEVAAHSGNGKHLRKLVTEIDRPI